MKKEVEISIIQVPKSVRFICPHCEEDLDIDFKEFGFTLSELFNDSVDFKCPLCEKELTVDYVELD